MTLHWNMLCYTDGQGNWTSEGCTTIDDGSGVIHCNCTHLTNFAILVVSLRPFNDRLLTLFLLQNIDARVDGNTCSNRAIEAFSIVGSVLSMIGLVLTITIFLAFK